MLKQILNIKSTDFLNLLSFPCMIHNTNNEKYGEAPYLLFTSLEDFYNYANHCKITDTLFVYFITTVEVSNPLELISVLLKDDSFLVPLEDCSKTNIKRKSYSYVGYTHYDKAFGQHWIGKLKHMGNVMLVKLDEAYMQGQFPKKFAKFNTKHKV